MQLIHPRLKVCLLSTVLAWSLTGCYTPAASQRYFVEASLKDAALEPIYSTAIYTVYFDYALARCVIHSAHTWGQHGGGGGGTGIGVAAFRCDPNRVRQRAEGLGLKTYPPKISPLVSSQNQQSVSPAASPRRVEPAQQSAPDAPRRIIPGDVP